MELVVFNNLLLFASSFLLVFLAGFQQLNVEHRKYLLSTITSIGIAGFNYVIFKLLPTGGLQLEQFLFFAAGGAIGINCAMYVHDKLMPKRQK
jgi:uncharacterized protein (DUF486 family)